MIFFLLNLEGLTAADFYAEEKRLRSDSVDAAARGDYVESDRLWRQAMYVRGLAAAFE